MQYGYHTDGKYWLRAGRRPWQDAWLKFLLIAGLIVVFWPLIRLLILLGAAMFYLACLSVFLIPLNAFLNSGSKPRSRRRRGW